MAWVANTVAAISAAVRIDRVQILVETQDEVIALREASVLPNANYRLAASDADGFAVDVLRDRVRSIKFRLSKLNSA
jgi:hypothetical protein